MPQANLNALIARRKPVMGWPTDPEEAPTAHDVARLIVMAAQALDSEKDGREFAKLKDRLRRGEEALGGLRCRALAYHVALALWPLAPAARLQKCFALSAGMAQVYREAVWWSDRRAVRLFEAWTAEADQ